MKQILVALTAVVAAFVWSPASMAATGFSSSGLTSATSDSSMTPEIKSNKSSKPKAGKPIKKKKQKSRSH